MREPDHSFPIDLFKMRELGVVRVHAKRMIVHFQKFADEAFDDLKVAHHLVCIEGSRGEDTLDLASVPMGKAAFIGMLRKHVAVFNFERFANTEAHEKICFELLN